MSEKEFLNRKGKKMNKEYIKAGWETGKSKKRKQNIREWRNRGFWLATVLLIMVSVFSFGGTVMSRTDFDAAEMEGYYREQEKNLERQVRAYFEEKGFENSGIMLTRVVDTDGSREYTIRVHHRELSGMSKEECGRLEEELQKLNFQDENSSFCYVLNDFSSK